MKITSFSPLIMTNDSEKAGKVFEALGFTKKHEKRTRQRTTTQASV